MATFYDNLRTIGKLPTRGYIQNNGVSSWDKEKIANVLDNRWAGIDSSENPMVSLNVDIPKTPTVRKIQTGKYKLSNDTNITGINNDNALYIIGNTYQDNNDNTYYGMGWDGRPYSYTIKDNVVGEFTPLDSDEQKKAIERLSDGKIKIHETITNPATLAEIYRSVKRMQDSGNGNLVPDNVVIGDSYPGSVTMPGGSGLAGIAKPNKGTEEEPDHIDLLGTDFPAIQAGKSNKGKQSGFHSTGGGDSVPQHELAHTAEFALLDSPQRYFDRIAKESEKYRGKYSAGNLFEDAFGKIKYAIPLLYDAVFGTHTVPTEKEVEAMSRSDNPNMQNMAEYWDDYYTPLEYKYDTVEEKINNKASRKADQWYDKNTDQGDRYGVQGRLFEKAAKNAGFNSVEDAIKSISTYATYNNNEAFAEAYSDVLINGNNAKPFSKELINVYMKVADDTAKMFGKNKPTQLKMFSELVDIIPEDTLKDPKKQLNRFQQNYRIFSE